jgi:hypothetical protein
MRRTLTLALLLWTACGNPSADLGGAPPDAGDTTRNEGGSDGSTNDGSSNDAMDAASDVTDGPSFDGDRSCTGTDTACGYANDAGTVEDGLCKAGTCSPCIDPTDDSRCSEAYADAGKGYLCISGDCIPSDCRTDTDCPADGGAPACIKNICTSCDSPTPGTYNVDPVSGSDSSTGSNMTGGHVAGACAFRTITHALSVVGAPSAATTITVLGPARLGSGEAFPLQVPANIVIKGGGTETVEIDVPPSAGLLGFALRGASSGIESMTIVGSAGVTAGIGVYTGTNPGDAGTNTYVKNVTIRGFADGLGVGVTNDGLIELKEGVTLTSNKGGLYLNQNAIAVSSNTNQSNPVTFSNNSLYGVIVLGSASVNFVGSAGLFGAGSIVASGNGAGFAIEQAGPSSNMPLNTLNGVVALSNRSLLTPGDGILLQGGSAALVRNSFLGGNVSGIRITAGPGINYDTTGIDLGKTSSFGMNTLQGAGNGGIGVPNGIGLCVDIPPTQSQSVYAEGNIWANTANDANLDCSAIAPDAGAAAVLSVSNEGTCAGALELDLGGQGFNPGSKLSVYVDNCTCSNGACR